MMQVRSARPQLLAELGAKKVTRGLAEAHPDLRPILALFSECHELFGHDEYGPVAAELATKTIKRARKTGITLLFDTQSSREGRDPAEAGRAGQRQRVLRRQDVAQQRRVPGRRVVRRGHPRDRAAARPGPRHVAGHGRVRRAVRAAALVLRRGRRRHGVRRRGRGDRPRGRPGRTRHAARGRPARCPPSRRATCSTTWPRCSAPERAKLRDAVGLLRALAPTGRLPELTAAQLRTGPRGRGRAGASTPAARLPGPAGPAVGRSANAGSQAWRRATSE